MNIDYIYLSWKSKLMRHSGNLGNRLWDSLHTETNSTCESWGKRIKKRKNLNCSLLF